MKTFTVQITVCPAHLPTALGLKSELLRVVQEATDRFSEPGMNPGGCSVLKWTDILTAPETVPCGTRREAGICKLQIAN